MGELYPNCEVHARRVDVGDEDAVKELVEEVIRDYGRLDVMFANAGVPGTPATFEDVSAEQFMATMRVNALGVFLCAKYAAIAMQRVNKEKGKEFPGGVLLGRRVWRDYGVMLEERIIVRRRRRW